MWLMMQQNHPDDFVIATGETHTVREFAEQAFSAVGLGWEDYVKEDNRLYRPLEVSMLCGDAHKARKALNWKPTLTFKELAEVMVKADLSRWERYLKGDFFPWDAPNYPSEIDIISRSASKAHKTPPRLKKWL